MADWTEGDLPVDGITLHYYRLGQPGSPPVVLLHGFSDMGLCWLRLATDLAAGYDFVMIDAVGHGRSGGSKQGFHLRAASDVLAVIDALGLERPALAGHSMGAATAASVAALAPERIRALVLEDPPWRDGPWPDRADGTPPSSRAPVGSPAWAEWIRAFQQRGRAEQQAMAASERPDWAEIDLRHWADAKAQFNLAVLTEMASAPPAPWRELVERIACPVLLLTGEPERGAIVTPALAQAAAAVWRTGRVVHIPGAGHNLRRENYAPYLAAVRAFLDETATA